MQVRGPAGRRAGGPTGRRADGAATWASSGAERARDDLRGLVHGDGPHLLPRRDDVARVRDQETPSRESVAVGRVS
nr:MAG TPA: hypothetical protein [Caudoviricetes sp.]